MTVPERPLGVLESCLYVDDLVAADDFYQRVLLLELYSRQPGRHSFFRCGDAMVLLFLPESTLQPPEPDSALPIPSHGAHGPGHLALHVLPESLPAWVNHLRDQGVTIEQEILWPGGGESIYFRDPAGNSLELTTATLWQSK